MQHRLHNRPFFPVLSSDRSSIQDAPVPHLQIHNHFSTDSGGKLLQYCQSTSPLLLLLILSDKAGMTSDQTPQTVRHALPHVQVPPEVPPCCIHFLPEYSRSSLFQTKFQFHLSQHFLQTAEVHFWCLCKERLPLSALFLPPQRFSEFLLFPQRSQMHLQSNSHSAHQNDSADS